MFSSFAIFASQTPEEVTPLRNIPPPTPVVFPRYTPSKSPSRQNVSKQSLVSYLQAIHRPTDLRQEHLEALNLHLIHDVPPESLLPDASFLPPREEWTSIPASELAVLNEGTKKPLSNGTKSPGALTYVERLGELSISNEAAFRTVRRVPAGPGHPLVRLGNAYEFFKNLELLANYWDDTSISPTGPEASDAMDVDTETKPENPKKQTRTGAGSSMTNDIRQNLLTSFVKLVSYDFGCNVTIPRLEPRLHLKSQGPNPLHSYFPTTPIFVYRTPISRQDARAGIVEGPIVALSPRPTTSFNGTDSVANEESQPIPNSPSSEEVADLSREIVNILTTAQHRAREHQTEVRYGDGKWWTTEPRWGGGVGGPIGREIKEPGPEKEKTKENKKETESDEKTKEETIIPSTELIDSTATELTSANPATILTSQINKINSKSSGNDKPERKKQKIRKKGGQMEIYDAYRMVRPPATNWDRKTRYMAIGKEADSPADEIFLISSLFHHVSIVRARVSFGLLEVLEGGIEEEEEHGLEELVVWRSRWFDLFRAEERVEAMGLVWGVMGYLLRGEEEKVPIVEEDFKENGMSDE